MARLTRRTFAIEPEVYEKVDALTDGHTQEANLLVNKALRRYLEWGRSVEGFKLVTIDPRSLKLFWSHITVDEAREMGMKNGSSSVVGFILYYFRKFDLDSVLKTFRVIGAEYSNVYVYSESSDDHLRRSSLPVLFSFTDGVFDESRMHPPTQSYVVNSVLN